MADVAEIVRDSPVDFATAVAYALHPDMRRLVIVAIVGAVLLPVGLQAALTRTLISGPLRWFGAVLGLVVAVAGATFLIAGVVGIVFKLVTDANRLAMAD